MLTGKLEDQKCRNLIKKATLQVKKIAQLLQQKESFTLYENKGFYGKLLSGGENLFFYSFLIKDKGFHVTDKCISCGECVRLCPLNNIVLENLKPVWKGNCTQCSACINRCPVEAIEYKNRTRNKKRYSFEKMSEIKTNSI